MTGACGGNRLEEGGPHKKVETKQEGANTNDDNMRQMGKTNEKALERQGAAPRSDVPTG